MEAALKYSDLPREDRPKSRRCQNHPRRFVELRWTESDSLSNQRLIQEWLRDEDVLVADFSDDRRRLTLAGIECVQRARQALAAVDEDARSRDYGLPSGVAKAAASRLLEILCSRYPRDYDVYATEDREVGIDVRGGGGRGVLILCDSDGGATCFVSLGATHRRAKYNDAADLPDGFVTDAIKAL